MVFNCFGGFVLFIHAYSVPGISFCTAPSAVIFCFFFWRFHVFTRTSFILLFNHYSHLGKHVRIFMRTNHARNMKHTLAITQFCRGFGTLILPLSLIHI